MTQEHTFDARDPLDQPLSFWEHGPVRSMLEAEFSMVLVQEVRVRKIAVDIEQEKAIHDAVIPKAFEFFILKGFTLVHFREIQAEIVRLLGEELRRFAR